MTRERRTNRLIRIDRYRQRVHHSTRSARPPGKNIPLRRHRRQLRCCARQVLSTRRQADNTTGRRRAQRDCVFTHKRRSDCLISVHDDIQWVLPPTGRPCPSTQSVTSRRHGRQPRRCTSQILTSHRQPSDISVRRLTQRHRVLTRKNCPNRFIRVDQNTEWIVRPRSRPRPPRKDIPSRWHRR